MCIYDLTKLLTKVRYPDMDIVWSLMLWKKIKKNCNSEI